MNVKLPATYDAAKQAITKLERVDECAKWADTAAALRAYAYQMKDRTLEVKAIRIRDRAVRQGGILLEKQKGKAGRRRKNEGTRAPSLKSAAAEAGIPPMQARDMSRVARVDGESFERQVESAKPPSVKELAVREPNQDRKRSAGSVTPRTAFPGTGRRLWRMGGPRRLAGAVADRRACAARDRRWQRSANS
jgi:hypothetical protein